MKLVLDLNIDQVNLLVDILKKELVTSMDERSDLHNDNAFYEQTVYIDNVNAIINQFL